jgi:drug/metabolite transporter (DMT)-like permease
MNLGVLFGLLAALTWGFGDFAAGSASRRTSPTLVSSLMNFFGLLMVVALALVYGEVFPGAGVLVIGVAAGLLGSLGFVVLLRAMDIGQMGIISPVSALLTAAIPVFYHAIFDKLPSWLQLLGFVLALLGVWLVSQPVKGAVVVRGIGLAVLSGVGFAGFKILMGQLPAEHVFWPVATSRFAGTVLTALMFWWQQRQTQSVPIKTMMIPWWLLIGAALMDSLGNVFFLRSSQTGSLDVAAVLASLYPAITTLLAVLILKERPTKRQVFAVGLMLVAVVLIAWKA